MKPKHAIIIAPFALLGLFAFNHLEDIIAKLGLKHSNVQTYILGNFTGSFNTGFENSETNFFFPRINNLKTIIGGDEAAAAKEICQYVRSYVNSEEFYTEYQKKREASKPTYEPDPTDPALLDNLRSSILELETQLAELKKSPNENAQTIALFEPMIRDQKAVLSEYEDPTPNNTKWEKNYPADPALLIRRKLQEYLDLVGTVDFNARLTEADKYNIKKFVNPAYESKPDYWKACFRAGKEANEVVTLFAKDWMKGEILSGPRTIAEKDAGYVADNKNSQGSNPPDTPAQTDAQDNAATANTNEAGKAGAPKEKVSLLGKLKKAKAILKD